MKKTVGFFARALERKAVHPPHYLPGVFLCSLSVKDKFVLFVQDSLNPIAFLDSGFNAGLDQASTITGSVANIIVVECSRKEASITFGDYFRVGLPVTVLTMPFGYVWLSWVK